MGFEITGRRWSSAEFEEYIQDVNLSWAKGVTLHHTASPSLAQRPDGLKPQHMLNLRYFYQKILGWGSGPHLFVDDDEILGMSSLWRRGIHARSFNKTHIGVEVVGNYDTEDPYSGRGEQCWDTAARATAILLIKMGLPASKKTINFHRDDPKTDKTCPGKRVDKDTFIAKVKNYRDTYQKLEPTTKPKLTTEQRLDRIERRLNII